MKVPQRVTKRTARRVLNGVFTKSIACGVDPSHGRVSVNTHMDDTKANVKKCQLRKNVI